MLLLVFISPPPQLFTEHLLRQLRPAKPFPVPTAALTGKSHHLPHIKEEMGSERLRHPTVVTQQREQQSHDLILLLWLQSRCESRFHDQQGVTEAEEELESVCT